MVTRQTEYTYEEAVEKLKIHNNDYMKVIKEFMNIDTNNESNKVKKTVVFTGKANLSICLKISLEKDIFIYFFISFAIKFNKVCNKFN